MSHDFKRLYLLNGALYTNFHKHIVNHIWSFILPRDILPWVALKGQIKVMWCSLGCVSYSMYYETAELSGKEA